MKHKKLGQLIVIEGPDGVGKSTLCAEAADRLVARGIKCQVMSFPGKDEGTIGKLVYEVHHNPEKYGISELTFTGKQALHIAAHIDAIERRIKPVLEAGIHILLDRFWWSTWVYGKVAGMDVSVLTTMIDLERAVWGETKPAAVVVLQRLMPIDRHENLDCWWKWRDEYQFLVDEEGSNYPTFTLDNCGTFDEAEAQLLCLIEPFLLTDKAKPKPKQAVQMTMALEEKTTGGLTFLTHLLPAKPTVVFDTYWRFAAERQRIFFNRLNGQAPPWTNDPILSSYKFTNAYRASDRVSQYLIRHVIYRYDLPSSPEEVFFRIMLFKLFNKIETWQMLEQQFGLITFDEYSFTKYDAVLTEAIGAGRAIYSAAYIMPSGNMLGHTKKHRNHLTLIERMMADELPQKLADSPKMHIGFDLLRQYPTLGDFLAYQLITDVNYSEITRYSETEFVVPGPGARDGIRKCFHDLGGLNESEIIRFVSNIQEAEFERLGLQFQSLWGRHLQLIDCQNLFCEVDKYARVKHPDILGISGRTRIKQKFQSKSAAIEYWFPPKWGINENISQREAAQSINCQLINVQEQ